MHTCRGCFPILTLGIPQRLRCAGRSCKIFLPSAVKLHPGALYFIMFNSDVSCVDQEEWKPLGRPQVRQRVDLDIERNASAQSLHSAASDRPGFPTWWLIASRDLRGTDIDTKVKGWTSQYAELVVKRRTAGASPSMLRRSTSQPRRSPSREGRAANVQAAHA